MIVEQLVNAAFARVGSDDFGDDTWQEGLEILVRSLNDEAALLSTRVDSDCRQLPKTPLRRIRVLYSVQYAVREDAEMWLDDRLNS